MRTEERHRDRDRRRRRHRDNSYDDDREDEDVGISGWKLGLVIGVIVVCFAMLYPTLFHPMLMGALGRGTPQPQANQQRPPIHPAMGGAGSTRHPGGHPSRPDMHPAMRMAHAQAGADAGGGGGKGMFTWMLPVYTVGVVIFLLYTLFKSKNKSKTKKNRRRGSYYDSEEDDVDDDDDLSEVDTKYGGKFGKKKLRGLQERLRQTEEAMSKILEQLEAVQAGGDPINLDEAEKVAAELESTVVPKEKKLELGLSETNEHYINDLEKALREFKVLSKEYDRAKLKKLKKEVSSTSEEELNSASESESDAEEEVRRKSKKNHRKREEKIEEKIEESEEEEGFDVDVELKKEEEEAAAAAAAAAEAAEAAESQKSGKARRRRAKKT